MTKTTIPMLALAIFLPGCGSARTNSTEEPLTWEGPLTEQVDYMVGDAKPALLRYEFCNRSKDAVRFLDATPDCRCTAPNGGRPCAPADSVFSHY
jgi:hypothetical protein